MLPQQITLIVEHQTDGAAFLPRSRDGQDGGKIVEVREDGTRRAPRIESFNQAIRWLMDNNYEPVEHKWIERSGFRRQRRHTYQKIDAQGANDTPGARQN